MSRSWIILVFAAALASFAATSEAVCVQPGSSPVVTWQGTPPQSGLLVVLFRADPMDAEHYVLMKRGRSGAFEAALPRPAAGTRTVAYRIATLRNSGVTLDNGRIEVSHACNTPLKMTPTAPQRLVVGSLVGEAGVPAGFLCDGIVGGINARNELRAMNACGEAAAARKIAATGNNNNGNGPPFTPPGPPPWRPLSDSRPHTPPGPPPWNPAHAEEED